jgi:hypothetical protein
MEVPAGGMVRRFCVLLVVLAVAAALTACGAGHSSTREDRAPGVVAAPAAEAAAETIAVVRETRAETSRRSEAASTQEGWSEPEVIPGTSPAAAVEIGVDRDGNVVAAWLGRRRVVYMATRSAVTGDWTAPARMGRADEYSGLSLAVAPNGVFVLAWLGRSGRRAHATTGSVDDGPRPPLAINRAHEQPEVDISAQGVATVAWSASDPAEFIPSESAVVTRRVNAQTGVWEPAVRFTTRWSGNVAAVALNAAGDAALLWDSCWYDHGSSYDCGPLELGTRRVGEAAWTRTEVEASVDIYSLFGGDARAVGIDAQATSTVVWVDDWGRVQAGTPGAVQLSGPDVQVDPPYETGGLGLDVDDRGRAIVAYRAGITGLAPACERPQVIEAVVSLASSSVWQAPRRLATVRSDNPCEPASNPAVLLVRDVALVAWREDVGAGETIQLAWLGLDDTTPAAPVSLAAPGAFDKPAIAANDSGYVVAAWSDKRGVAAIFSRVPPV